MSKGFCLCVQAQYHITECRISNLDIFGIGRADKRRSVHLMAWLGCVVERLVVFAAGGGA